MMTIVKWRLLVLLERHKKVTLVAQELGLKQPTVTFHMKKMEEEWETVLFHTKTGRILLTDAGRILHRFALQMLQLHEEARQEMKLRGAAVKRLRIQLDVPCREEAAALAGLLLQPFGYALSFTERCSEHADTEQGEPDLLIREALQPSLSKGLHFWEAELKLGVSASHSAFSSLSAQELMDAGVGWIATEASSLLRRQSLNWAAQRQERLFESYTVPDTGTARAMAAQGLGFAILPDFSINGETEHYAQSAQPAAVNGLRLLPLPATPAYGLELVAGAGLQQLDEALYRSLFGGD
ncbi:DNA-binding transcriptional regulator, LysR family [Paenibacillaceae bacterium GAS479]|nr:DNA-binding transcriptional regulator, LysR family [Paenibacillaceae bacterium GAS479]